MELGLYQEQRISLVMTPKLRQAIELLQFSTIDLSKFIQEQAVENPLIELEGNFRVEEKFEFNNRNKYYTNNNEEYSNILDSIQSKEKDLYEDLIDQVKWLNVSDREKSILNYLILNLDENGYLLLKNEEIQEQLAISETEVKSSVQLLHQLEPAGVGARGVKECLLLQVHKYYPNEPLILRVINEYLEMLSEKRWKKISLELNIPLSEIRRIANCIQSLNPRPCINMINTSTRYLFPDVIVDRKNNDYVISLNDQYVPKILVNEQYMNLMNGNNNTSEYVKDKFQKYLWLLKSIEQRRTTILKIVEYVVRKQQDFLENGFLSLHPMTLEEVAEEIGMHESTVSRAISNKVIQTPIGSFEMKKLFTSRLVNSNGDSTSSAKVKILIKSLVVEEDEQKPYSDQKIVDYLKEHHGINISRRTVGKYREELNILSSAKRKLIV